MSKIDLSNIFQVKNQIGKIEPFKKFISAISSISAILGKSYDGWDESENEQSDHIVYWMGTYQELKDGSISPDYYVSIGCVGGNLDNIQLYLEMDDVDVEIERKLYAVVGWAVMNKIRIVDESN